MVVEDANIGAALAYICGTPPSTIGCARVSTREENQDPSHDALTRVLAMAEEGAWDQAATRLREMLEAAPEDPTVLCWLGVAELELGLDGVAYERFRRALAAEPTDPFILATAGSALARLDDPAAESALRSAALLGPDVAAARLHYGAYLTREGMFEDALVELSAAAALDPEDALTMRELGTLFAFTGRREQAIESYEAALRADPQDGQVYVLLGLELVAHEAMDEAAAAMTEGAQQMPWDLNAQLLAALAAQAAELPDAAAEFAARARLVADEEDTEIVDAVEGALDRADEDSREMLATLVATEVRRRRAERP